MTWDKLQNQKFQKVANGENYDLERTNSTSIEELDCMDRWPQSEKQKEFQVNVVCEWS